MTTFSIHANSMEMTFLEKKKKDYILLFGCSDIYTSRTLCHRSFELYVPFQSTQHRLLYILCIS